MNHLQKAEKQVQDIKDAMTRSADSWVQKQWKKLFTRGTLTAWEGTWNFEDILPEEGDRVKVIWCELPSFIGAIGIVDNTATIYCPIGQIHYTHCILEFL